MTKDEALKLALEAIEGVLDDSPKVLEASITGGLYEVVQCRDAITAIKEALAQPEQEPVQTIPSFTQLQQIIKNLEHCLSRDSKQEFLRVWIRDWTEHKLSQNTTPPQRKPLTDEEVVKMDEWLFDQPFWRVLMLVRAIEAAHGIKGEA